MINRLEYKRNYRKTPIGKLHRRMRKRFLKAVGQKVYWNFGRMVGCNARQLKAKLEEKFYNHPDTGKQMSWDNYGLHGWHIDHIKPLKEFNLHDIIQACEAMHFSNLRPFWAEEHRAKTALENSKKGQ